MNNYWCIKLINLLNLEHTFSFLSEANFPSWCSTGYSDIKFLSLRIETFISMYFKIPRKLKLLSRVKYFIRFFFNFSVIPSKNDLQLSPLSNSIFSNAGSNLVMTLFFQKSSILILQTFYFLFLLLNGRICKLQRHSCTFWCRDIWGLNITCIPLCKQSSFRSFIWETKTQE